MTRLLEVVNELGVHPESWRSSKDVSQESLDAIAQALSSRLSEEDISEHNISAYDNSTREYDEKESNKLVVPTITSFVDAIAPDGLVLDLGCGHGRDTLYFSAPRARAGLSQEDGRVPDHSLRCVPLDGARQFLQMTYYKLRLHDAIEQVPLMLEGAFANPASTRTMYSRDHNLEKKIDDHDEVFDGIWACASMLIHTAPEQIAAAVRSWSDRIKPGGVFAGSYIRGSEPGYKFLASRSAPGEIKVFTHLPDEVVHEALTTSGLEPLDRSTASYSGHGYEQKDFFGDFLYKKR